MADLPSEGEIEITGDKYIHLARSVRARPSDTFRLFDGNGAFAHAMIDKIDSEKIIAKIIEHGNFDNRPNTRLTLGFGLIPQAPLKILLAGATQLGANEFIPFKSKYSDIQIPEGKEDKALDRWDRIIIENSAVAWRSHLPKISKPLELSKIIEISSGFDYRFVFWEERGDHWSKHLPVKSGSVIALIGPKGGFHDDEIAQLTECGFKVLSFGDLICKAEIASIAACARIIGV